MGRPPSIPNDLEMEIIKLWIAGKNADEILDWIHGTNKHRALPVSTSAGSVQRVLDKHINLESTLPPLAVALEARRAAPKLWEELDRIDAEYQRLTDGVTLLPTVDEQRRASVLFRDKLRGLAQRERIIVRKLRLAGLGDQATPRLLLKHESLVKTVERDLLEEDHITGKVDSYLEICNETTTAELVSGVLEIRAELAARAEDRDRNEASNRPETPVQPEIIRPKPVLREVGDVPEEQYARPAEIPIIEDPDWTLSPECAEAWREAKMKLHQYIHMAWVLGAPTGLPPLPQPLPPGPKGTLEQRIALHVPILQIPPWVEDPQHRAAIVRQMPLVNAWLHWLRGSLGRLLAKPESPVLQKKAA
jgi:hypothetical protein